MPFVQGQLRQEYLAVKVETECVHCGQALHLEIDSELRARAADEGAEPLVFTPLVDFGRLRDPSIVDAF